MVQGEGLVGYEGSGMKIWLAGNLPTIPLMTMERELKGDQDFRRLISYWHYVILDEVWDAWLHIVYLNKDLDNLRERRTLHGQL